MGENILNICLSYASDLFSEPHSNKLASWLSNHSAKCLGKGELE